MENPATTTDLAGSGFVLPDGEAAQTRAQYELDRAWRALQSEPELRGRLAANITAGRVDLGVVVDVVVAGAKRALANPDGVAKESNSIDDWSETREFSTASTDMYFTAAEKRRCMPVNAVVATAGSIRYC